MHNGVGEGHIVTGSGMQEDVGGMLHVHTIAGQPFATPCVATSNINGTQALPARLFL